MRTTLMGLLAAATLLAACTERPQTAGSRKADDAAWRSAGSAFATPDYKGGDQARWDEQIRKRTQGQNEYSRSVAGTK